MEKNEFQIAVARAEAKYGAEWQNMAPRARTDAIYLELRELDRKAVERLRRPGNVDQGEAETAGSLARP
jgi:hypothetical protein